MPGIDDRDRTLETLRFPADSATGYFASRFTPDPRRDRVWKHIVVYLSHWWSAADAVLDVGAGYCSFINAVAARRRVAVDVHDRLSQYAAPGVEVLQASATDLGQLPSDAFDVVFASNLLEHLTRDEIFAALGEFRRVAVDDGRLILIQPNYRLASRSYWDDYTHVTPLSDRSLTDMLKVVGCAPLDVQARFLPLTIASRLGHAVALTPIYLRLPWRPFAGQMLVVARATGEAVSDRENRQARTSPKA